MADVLELLGKDSLVEALPDLEKHAAETRQGLGKKAGSLGEALSTAGTQLGNWWQQGPSRSMAGLGTALQRGGEGLSQWYQNSPNRDILRNAAIGTAVGGGLGGLTGLVSGPAGHKRPFMGAMMGGLLGGAVGGGVTAAPGWLRSLGAPDRRDAAIETDADLVSGMSHQRDLNTLSGADSIGPLDPTTRLRAFGRTLQEARERFDRGEYGEAGGAAARAGRHILPDLGTPLNNLTTHGLAHGGTFLGTEFARRQARTRFVDPHLLPEDTVAGLTNSQVASGLRGPWYRGWSGMGGGADIIRPATAAVPGETIVTGGDAIPGTTTATNMTTTSTAGTPGRPALTREALRNARDRASGNPLRANFRLTSPALWHGVTQYGLNQLLSARELQSAGHTPAISRLLEALQSAASNQAPIPPEVTREISTLAAPQPPSYPGGPVVQPPPAILELDRLRKQLERLRLLQRPRGASQ